MNPDGSSKEVPNTPVEATVAYDFIRKCLNKLERSAPNPEANDWKPNPQSKIRDVADGVTAQEAYGVEYTDPKTGVIKRLSVQEGYYQNPPLTENVMLGMSYTDPTGKHHFEGRLIKTQSGQYHIEGDPDLFQLADNLLDFATKTTT